MTVSGGGNTASQTLWLVSRSASVCTDSEQTRDRASARIASALIPALQRERLVVTNAPLRDQWWRELEPCRVCTLMASRHMRADPAQQPRSGRKVKASAASHNHLYPFFFFDLRTPLRTGTGRA